METDEFVEVRSNFAEVRRWKRENHVPRDESGETLHAVFYVNVSAGLSVRRSVRALGEGRYRTWLVRWRSSRSR